METPKFLHTSEFVKPVELKVVPDTPAAGRIFALILDHDGLTLREISQKLSIVENTVRTCLNRLMHDGSIKRAPKLEGERRQRWVVGTDDRAETYQSKSKQFMASQKTVYVWESMKIQPQNPFSALFTEGDE